MLKSAGASVLVGLAILHLTSVAARAAIRVTVSYTAVSVEISPHPGEHRSSHSLTFLLEGHSFRSFKDAGENSSGAIGESLDVPDAGGLWRNRNYIANGAFVHESANASQLITTTIDTNGTDSCRARRSVRLRAGHTDFEDRWNNEPVVFSSIHYEGVTCTITTE